MDRCRRWMLPASLEAPADARWLIVDELSARSHQSLAGDAALITSELVTNAVIHGAPPIHLHLDAIPPVFRITVTDHGSGEVRITTDVDRHDRIGRGLRLVDALSHAWGTQRANGCTTVWADLWAPTP